MPAPKTGAEIAGTRWPLNAEATDSARPSALPTNPPKAHTHLALFFVSGTTTQGNCTEAATPRCTLGNLAAGASATVRWVVHTRGNGNSTTQAAASTTRQETSTGNKQHGQPDERGDAPLTQHARLVALARER